jgi:uncharacterized protein YdeI (YjbR/CyaY-like superfamily)
MAGKKKVTDSFDRLSFRDRQAWRAWLEREHAKSPGIWMIYYKKGSGKQSVDYNDAVEEALCFGWIDTTVRSLDAERYLQLFMPRKTKSAWSKSNKERVERLIAQKLMAPAGLDKIDAAKRDGSWTTFDSVEALTIPPDFKKALAANKKARDNFRAFTDGKKKALLYLIHGAKLPETRRKRILKAVALAAANRVI